MKGELGGWLGRVGVGVGRGCMLYFCIMFKFDLERGNRVSKC